MNETTVYQADGPREGEVWVLHREPQPILPYWSGRFLIAFSLAVVFFLAAPFIFIEARWHLSRLVHPEPQTIKTSKFAEIIRLSDLTILQPADPQFSLIIPKIGVNSQIIPNVPAGDKKQYRTALEKGVVHAAGSYLPGENGSVYLFGHSTDYVWNIAHLNAVFYLLKELEAGDQVNLFYQNQRYVYQVTEKKIMAAEDLSHLKPRVGEEKIILQTCWPPGTTWKRLVVIATKVG